MFAHLKRAIGNEESQDGGGGVVGGGVVVGGGLGATYLRRRRRRRRQKRDSVWENSINSNTTIRRKNFIAGLIPVMII